MLQIFSELALAFIFCFFSYICFLLWIQAEPNHEDKLIQQQNSIKESSKLCGDDFTIYKNQQVELENSYRENSKLKFTIQGVHIDGLELQDRKVWSWKVKNSKKSKINFYKKCWKDLNVSEYHFRWPAVGEKLDQNREVCFHYGTRGEYW